MKLGVDLGTTRTIVATADRGNYPVVTFYDGDGEAHEHLPSVVALDDDRLVFGFEALAAARAGAPLTRSFKRVLAAPDVTAETPVTVGTRQVPVLELLTAYAAALRTALVEQSSLSEELTVDSELQAAVGVPAHAHGPQRFLTLEAFRRAGFTVVAMLNEPSAAGFEFTHRRRREITRNRTRVVVYDLGGGTFDASVVDVAGTHHEVLGTVGLNHVGGDDFDLLLADLAAESIHQRVDDLSAPDRDDLLEQARELKEHLSPQTRRLTLEVAGTEVGVPVTAFYGRATPLVEQTVDAMGPLMGDADDHVDELHDVAGIYLVGGASGLPLVPRLLKERFGRRVHRSPLPAASTAIGLAIATDDDAGYSLRDRLSRGFGVFRELRDGEAVGFDPVLGRTDVLEPSGCRTATRRYRAAHDVGWYRYVEHTDLDEHGGPTGDLVPFAEVLFPFDPVLRDGRDLTRVPVQRRDDGPLVEERYTLDEHGIVQVRITDLDSGYSQVHALRADG